MASIRKNKTETKRMSKHDNPDHPFKFRNWRKELDEVIGTLPRGQECVDIDCKKLVANRGAFLCTECGMKYYDSYKGIIVPTEQARAQLNWIKIHILAQDPE